MNLFNKELAEIANVSERPLEKWIEEAVISFIRIRRVNLFDPEQVIEDLKKFEQPARYQIGA